MQISDIIALSKAGFTAEQITAMAQVPESPQAPIQVQPQVQAQVQPQVQVQAQVQPQIQAPVQVPVQANAQVAANEQGYDAVLAKLGIIEQGINNANILNSQQPQPRTTDDIIAEIINPPVLKREEK